MNSSNIAVHFGRRMLGVATRRLQIGVATVLVTLLLALPVGARVAGFRQHIRSDLRRVPRRG